MLKVTIELIPAQGGDRKVIATAHINNDGTGTTVKGNYTAVFYNDRGVMVANSKVRGFDRIGEGPWLLLHDALVGAPANWEGK